MKKGQTSVNRSATRAGARPPKMALARILRSGFRRVIRKPSTSRTLRPVVPPEDARDALQAQLGAARSPSASTILEAPLAWPVPLP